MERLITEQTYDASVSPGTLLADGPARKRVRSPEYERRLAEAATVFQRALEGGQREVLEFREALSRADFAYLFSDVLDRQLLAYYREFPAPWADYAKRAVVPDFRDVKRYDLLGGAGLLEKVPELSEYPARSVTDNVVAYRVEKYGAVIPVSWEALTNDDLNALAELPQRLALAARRTEAYFVTSLYVGSSGPLGTVYSGGNGNVVTGNPALSITGLQTAMQVLGGMRDSDGQPVLVEAVTLVVPPALEVVARNILNATTIEVGPSSETQRLQTANWMRNRVTLVVNPYIPYIASTNGNTSWFLFAQPSGRPAIEVGFLRGNEDPQLFVRAGDAQRIGGGSAVGDFATDTVTYKVRHIIGGAVIDPKMTVASNGTGS